MNPLNLHHQILAETIINNLKKRNMNGYFCPTAKEAQALAMSFVSEGSTVGIGGSESLKECGIIDSLKARADITIYSKADCRTPEEADLVMHQAFMADCYMMSTNAMTVQGELVNIDNTGNRVASLIYGPKRVVIVTGMNKVAPNLEDALHRARNIASPLNCIRLGRTTPCTKTGYCRDCLADGCLCNQIVITRRSLLPDRIHVILVAESIGY